MMACRLLLICIAVLSGFTICSALRHGQISSLDKVDVLFSSDKRLMTGLRTAVYSTLVTTGSPERLRIHIAVQPNETCDFRKAFGIPGDRNSRFLQGGASLTLHVLDVEELHSLYPKHGALREDGPSNYARFFIDRYLPADSKVGIWLDTDVVVQADVMDLARSMAKQPSKTIGFVQYPGQKQGFGSAYTLMEDLTNRSWGRAHINANVLRHAVWNAGVLAFNIERMRDHQLTNRAIQWINISQHVGLARNGGSQTALVLAALVHPREADSFIEVDPNWNCWWGFVGESLTDEEKVRACKIIHFAGHDKPWNDPVPYSLKGTPMFLRWTAAELKSRDFFH